MRFIRWAEILLIFSFGSAGMAWAATPAACGTSLTAGFTIVSVPNQPGGSNYPSQTVIKMGIWYPSLTAASSYGYDTDISGQVALNSTITDCGSGVQFPLIVFSHGWSGCGIQSVFLTEELARRGYIVAAPDHEDHGCSVDGGGKQTFQDINADFPLSKFGDSTAWTDTTGNYRNVDIKTVTDWLLATSPWKDRINASEIGMTGHSFGGYTAFAKIGGWSSWLDTRFKAGIMYSPFIQAFQATKLHANTVPNPTVPQMFQGGTLDIGITPCIKGPQPAGKVCPNPGQPGAFQQAQFPSGGGSKFFAELGASSRANAIDASHYAFSNKICGGSSTAPTTVQACLANVPNAQLIVNYSQYFLDHFLQGQNPAQNPLYSNGAGWNTYWRTSGVPAGTYQTALPAARSALASIKGENLGTVTAASAGSPSMPMSLNGITVSLLDNAGASRPAPLYAISPTQYNFVIPEGTPDGIYTVVAKDSTTAAVIALGPISVQGVSPAFFAISPGPGHSGPGFGWGWSQQATASGDTAYKAIYDPNAQAPIPIDVTQGATYLVLAATGVRFAPGMQATIGGVSVPVNSSPYQLYQGIDTIALGPLPASLAGQGQVNIVVTVGGMQSNQVAVVIQ